jgi:hypothetical protein
MKGWSRVILVFTLLANCALAGDGDRKEKAESPPRSTDADPKPPDRKAIEHSFV